ncbi:hypothetical protein ACIBQ1_51075 [Nonomuraea sp. NPDC050153]|uniref:hypothetical protein n=1 Tax=Nonomuraea sp. NPDC050153 TaxID=3364359 RepID=UPI0037A55969
MSGRGDLRIQHAQERPVQVQRHQVQRPAVAGLLGDRDRVARIGHGSFQLGEFAEGAGMVVVSVG